MIRLEDYYLIRSQYIEGYHISTIQNAIYSKKKFKPNLISKVAGQTINLPLFPILKTTNNIWKANNQSQHQQDIFNTNSTSRTDNKQQNNFFSSINNQNNSQQQKQFYNIFNNNTSINNNSNNNTNTDHSVNIFSPILEKSYEHQIYSIQIKIFLIINLNLISITINRKIQTLLRPNHLHNKHLSTLFNKANHNYKFKFLINNKSMIQIYNHNQSNQSIFSQPQQLFINNIPKKILV